MTGGGETGSARQSSDVIPVCFSFSSVPIPSLTTAWRQAGRGRGEEREWEEGILGKPPHPPAPPPSSGSIQTLNCSELLSTFQNADSKLCVSLSPRSVGLSWCAGLLISQLTDSWCSSVLFFLNFKTVCDTSALYFCQVDWIMTPVG